MFLFAIANQIYSKNSSNSSLNVSLKLLKNEQKDYITLGMYMNVRYNYPWFLYIL